MIDASRNTEAEPISLPALPRAARAISDRLADAGQRVHWVGPGLTRMLEGTRVGSFALATDASTQRLTELFSRAVPIADGAGTVTIPSAVGPISATPYRFGGGVLDELAHVDFTIHAMAYDARQGTLLDPFGGQADLVAGRLRAVGSAAERLAEDPLRGLRAVRIAAVRGIKLVPELELALVGTGRRMARIPRYRVRGELVATLLAPGVGPAWPLLERSGIGHSLAPGSRMGAGPLLERLPFELEVRLAGWLRGTRARRALQRLRFTRAIVDRVDRLLQLHPIDGTLDPSRLSAVARLERREDSADLIALIAMRRAELAVSGATAAAAARLDDLEQALAHVRSQRKSESRARLAIDGAEIMKLLGWAPGPNVGLAIAYLSEQVARDPSQNDPDTLRTLLLAWSGAAD